VIWCLDFSRRQVTEKLQNDGSLMIFLESLFLLAFTNLLFRFLFVVF
jgi:hypothetical protein